MSDMSDMFYNAKAFNKSLNGWNVSEKQIQKICLQVQLHLTQINNENHIRPSIKRLRLSIKQLRLSIKHFRPSIKHLWPRMMTKIMVMQMTSKEIMKKC